MSEELAVALREVNASVGDFALRDVSFEVPAGFVMGFVGPNGAGKTTTIRCLLGMQAVRSGEIEVLGRRLPAPAEMRQDIGVVLDRTCLVGEWRLNEVERVLRPFYRRWDTSRYRTLLAEFGLDPRARVKELSRGMSMKLMIAIALSHQARLLVLDEPTSGLDPVARDELIGILGEFLTDEQHSVLFSTHITTDLERIADYVTLIQDGRIVRTGTKEDLIDGYRVVQAGPDDLRDLVGVELIGARRSPIGVRALVRTDEAELLGRDVLTEAPTLDDIVVHVGSGRTERPVDAEPQPGRLPAGRPSSMKELR